MAGRREVIKVESALGVTIHNSLMVHEPTSGKLMALLPGQGYTVEHPLMYYVRRMALEHGYDALSVQYGFQAAHVDFSGDQAQLRADVFAALNPVLERGYKQVCVVGKSLGTPLAAEVAQTLDLPTRLILLTPLRGVVSSVGAIETLAVIGSADSLYNAAEVERSAPNATWRVFDDLNHSLEVRDDWGASLAVLPKVISACETFLVVDE